MVNPSKADRPSKPRPDWPLFPHRSGQWAKKIRGRMCYFGPWADADGARQRWLCEKDFLLAGKTPPPDDEHAVTLRHLCNHFLTAKKRRIETGELTKRSFLDYHNTCGRIVDALGKEVRVDLLTAADFEKLRSALSRGVGPVTAAGHLARARVLFRYAYTSELIEKPLRYEAALKKPSASVLRKAKKQNGSKMFEPGELRLIIDGATPQMKAMILLAINTGVGPSDLGQMTQEHLDLDRGWMDYPRPKTGCDRRDKLWPETVSAIKKWIDLRPASDLQYVFLTKQNQSWYQDSEQSTRNPLSAEFRKLLKRIDRQSRDGEPKTYKSGRGLYAIRHSFQTVADETLDQPAVDLCMGHTTPRMEATYRQRISDERLARVAECVHDWLFGH